MKYYYYNQMKGGEMDWTYHMVRGDEKFVQECNLKTWREEVAWET